MFIDLGLIERVSGVSNPGALRNLGGPFLLEEIQFKRKETSYERNSRKSHLPRWYEIDAVVCPNRQNKEKIRRRCQPRVSPIEFSSDPFEGKEPDRITSLMSNGMTTAYSTQVWDTTMRLMSSPLIVALRAWMTRREE